MSGDLSGTAGKLASIAAALQALSHWRNVPALWFLTDEQRAPDPAAIAARLPKGSAIVLRHYGSPRRGDIAQELAAVARARGLHLLVAADLDLALSVGAHGLHLPRWARPPSGLPSGFIVSASVHDEAEVALRAPAADVLIASPVFPTASHAGDDALGIEGLVRLVRASPKPVVALGGISVENAASLGGTGVAGIAAIGAFLDR